MLSDAVLCHDLRLDASDPSQLYVATVSGAVAHCSRHSSRMHPRAYLPEIGRCCENLYELTESINFLNKCCVQYCDELIFILFSKCPIISDFLSFYLICLVP